MCNEENYTCEHFTKMLKILIPGIVTLPKVKKLWSYINDSLYQESLYTIISTIIAYLPKLQQEDLIARMIQKVLATPNVNVYSGQSGKPWSEVERVIYYDGKYYIPKTL